MIIKEQPDTCPATTPGDGDDDDNLAHFFCCDPNRALCGSDLTRAEWDFDLTDDDPEACVVCVDLSRVKHRKCGAQGCRGNRRRWFR